MTIQINAGDYADSDNCLADAANDYAADHGLEGWDLNPRWADNQRDAILLDIPDHAAEQS